MKCISINCKCEPINKAKKLFGDNETIGFCRLHSPEWINNIKIGGYSPVQNMMGINKSWYQKVK